MSWAGSIYWLSMPEDFVIWLTISVFTSSQWLFALINSFKAFALSSWVRQSLLISLFIPLVILVLSEQQQWQHSTQHWAICGFILRVNVFFFFFVFFLIARRLSLVESKFSSAIVFPIKLPSSLFHRICYCLISVFSHGDIRNRFGNLFRPNNGWHYLHVDLHCSIARVL